MPVNACIGSLAAMKCCLATCVSQLLLNYQFVVFSNVIQFL